MKPHFLILLAGLPALCVAIGARGDNAKTITIDHRTLDFVAEGWQRFELSGSISGNGGKAKIWRTSFPNADVRNYYGDHREELPKDAKVTENDIRFELYKGDPDPSPSKDRILYEIKGINLGTNRKLLLMVSSVGPQRIIYVGRCGGVWATTLEPRNNYGGPKNNVK